MALNAQELQRNKIQSGDINTFFDCLSDILLKYSGGELIHAENFKKCFSPYMLCRYLSMKLDLLYYAEYLNMLQGVLTNEQFYLLAYKLIPKQRSGYIKYIKKADKKDSKNNEEEINSNNVESLLFELWIFKE